MASTVLVIVSLAGCTLPMLVSRNFILGIGIGVLVMIAGMVGLVKWRIAYLKHQGIKGAMAYKEEHPRYWR